MSKPKNRVSVYKARLDRTIDNWVMGECPYHISWERCDKGGDDLPPKAVCKKCWKEYLGYETTPTK